MLWFRVGGRLLDRTVLPILYLILILIRIRIRIRISAIQFCFFRPGGTDALEQTRKRTLAQRHQDRSWGCDPRSQQLRRRVHSSYLELDGVRILKNLFEAGLIVPLEVHGVLGLRARGPCWVLEMENSVIDEARSLKFPQILSAPLRRLTL